jgi:hypothetical protein
VIPWNPLATLKPLRGGLVCSFRTVLCRLHNTLLLLHRTQSLAYVLGLALGTLLGVFGFGAFWSLALQRELLPSHSVASPFRLLALACAVVGLVGRFACMLVVFGWLGSVCWSRVIGLLR